MAVGEFARLLGVLLGTLVFISFMGLEICKAFKKGVQWVPGHALVLTALTIQIMTFVENQSNRALLGSRTLEDENNFIMIHSSRVMLCVLVAFFLPGMSRATYEEKWTKIAALGLTVFIDIFSELLTVYRRLAHSKYGVSWVSFMVSDILLGTLLLGTLLFISFIAVLLGTLLFISFIAADIRKAFKKGVQWVPGHALVLTALTIQIMTFVENQSNRALLGSQTLEDEASENNFIMIHSSRVMLCVLVAFFLPAMARASYEEKWTKIAALGLTVFIDIFSELLTVYRRFAHSMKGLSLPSKRGLSWVSFMVSDMLISISLLWLILLLICATLASKSIRNITHQRNPIILAERDLPNCWPAIQNQVLKSWIVVCVCHPQSIIAKSVLASSAALVVTMCIVSSIVGWIARGPSITIPADAQSWLKGIIIILEVVFILLGWVVICWRTLASLPYCERWNEKTWFKQFLVEDFWTRHIQDELEKEESEYHFRIAYSWTKQVEAKESERKLKEDGNSWSVILTAVWRKASLRCFLWLQFIVVFFSKVSCFLIEVTFYNWVIRKIASVVLTDQNEEVRKQFEHYYKAILENVYVVGETPWSVFATNRKAIKQAVKLSEDGYKEGKESCKSLVTFLKDKMSSPDSSLLTGKMLPPLCVGVRGSFIPPLKEDETAAGPDSRLKFLCKPEPGPQLKEETYFKYMSRRSWSWKLTAVSLINIIVSLSPPCGIEAFIAYFEAWQLMDMVDEWDPDSDSLLRKAADTEFNTLMVKVRQSTGESCPYTIPREQMAAKITELAGIKRKELQEECEKEKQSTPVDWGKLAAAIALYKLYTSSAYYTSDAEPKNGLEKSREFAELKNESENPSEFAELKNELESSLADIISVCIVKVGIALVDNCRRWAQDLEEENEKEEKLLKAIYIAGKCKGLVEELGWSPHINTTTEDGMVSTMKALDIDTTTEELSMV